MKTSYFAATILTAALSACGSVGAAPSFVPSSTLTGTAILHPKATTTTPFASPTSSVGGLAAIADEGTVTYSKVLLVCHAQDGGKLPDPICTPGSVDPAVTQNTISTTICKSGWTKTIRPAVDETDKAKAYTYQAYEVAPGTASEEDHLVPLELGGSNDITNLWPEVGKIPNPKDKVENALRTDVCDGKMTLTAARDAIAKNWETATP